MSRGGIDGAESRAGGLSQRERPAHPGDRQSQKGSGGSAGAAGRSGFADSKVQGSIKESRTTGKSIFTLKKKY